MTNTKGNIMKTSKSIMMAMAVLVGVAMTAVSPRLLASGKAVAKTAVDVKVAAKELREDPKLGFAPLPIKFGETVGLVVHFNQGETLNHLADLKNLGVKWVRDEESWGGVEKQKGKYTWPTKRKKRLKFYKENDIGVIFALTYAANKNVYPDDPYNPKGFGAYAVAAARLHKEAGVDVVLEIFNEPHNFGLMKKYGGKWYGSADCPWIDHYIKMANEAIKQTKAYDSKIKLITDEDVWTNHYWYLAGNLDKRLDGFAIHPYTFHGHTPGPEKAHFGQGTEGWMKGWTIIDGDRSMRSLMRRLRAEYLEKIGRPMEMYITEWGHPVGGKGYKKGEKMTEDDIAAYLPRAYMSGVAAGARVVCWHVSQDMGDGPMGLIRNDQTKRKSYYALKTMVEQLGEYRMIKQLSGMENTTKGVQAYLFEGDAGYKLVAWNIDGPVEVFFESASSAPLRVYNNFDKPVGFRFAKDGPPILSLGKAPIYIEGIGKDCSLKLVPKLVDDSEEKAADKAKTKARPRGNETNVLAWLKKYNSEKYLKGYKLVKQIAGVKNPNKGIQGYLFEGDAGYKLVAWTTGKTVKVLFEPGYTLRPRVSNHLGKGVNFGYAKDGPPILKLNKAPIFIEGIGKECSLELMEQIK